MEYTINREDVEKVIDTLKNKLSDIDIDFFNGLYQMFKYIVDNYTVDESFNIESFLKEDEKISELEEINRIEEFYSSINSELGEMAHNCIRTANFLLGNDPLSSESREIVLAGTNYSALLGIHELAHRFSTAGMETAFEKSSILSHIVMDECGSILAEMLGEDFLLKKYKVDIPLRTTRTKNILELATNESDFFRDENRITLNRIKKMDILLKKIRNEKLNDENLGDFSELIYCVFINEFHFDSETQTYHLLNSNSQNANQVLHFFLTSFNHEFATIYARYLYQEIQKDPKKINLFYAIIASNSYSKQYSKEQIEYFEKLGFPFIKNGKIVCDSDSVAKMTSAFDEYISSNKGKIDLAAIHREAENLDEMHKPAKIFSSIVEENEKKRCKNIRGKIIDAIKEAPLDKIDEAMARCGSDVAKKEEAEAEAEVKT